MELKREVLLPKEIKMAKRLLISPVIFFVVACTGLFSWFFVSTAAIVGASAVHGLGFGLFFAAVSIPVAGYLALFHPGDERWTRRFVFRKSEPYEEKEDTE